MNKTRLNNTTKLIIGGLLSISIVAGSFTAVNAYNDGITNKADVTPTAKIKSEKLVVTEESKKPAEIKKETPKEVPAINARAEKKVVAKSEDSKVADEKETCEQIHQRHLKNSYPKAIQLYKDKNAGKITRLEALKIDREEIRQPYIKEMQQNGCDASRYKELAFYAF